VLVVRARQNLHLGEATCATRGWRPCRNSDDREHRPQAEHVDRIEEMIRSAELFREIIDSTRNRVCIRFPAPTRKFGGCLC
jgi:hypothetical protein